MAIFTPLSSLQLWRNGSFMYFPFMFSMCTLPQKVAYCSIGMGNEALCRYLQEAHPVLLGRLYSISWQLYSTIHMRTQRPTRGEAQLITMILCMLYRNNHFQEISVRIMGGKGRKPEFGHQLRSNQYHPSTKKRHA